MTRDHRLLTAQRIKQSTQSLGPVRFQIPNQQQHNRQRNQFFGEGRQKSADRFCFVTTTRTGSCCRGYFVATLFAFCYCHRCTVPIMNPALRLWVNDCTAAASPATESRGILLNYPYRLIVAEARQLSVTERLPRRNSTHSESTISTH